METNEDYMKIMEVARRQEVYKQRMEEFEEEEEKTMEMIIRIFGNDRGI